MDALFDDVYSMFNFFKKVWADMFAHSYNISRALWQLAFSLTTKTNLTTCPRRCPHRFLLSAHRVLDFPNFINLLCQSRISTDNLVFVPSLNIDNVACIDVLNQGFQKLSFGNPFLSRFRSR